MDLTDLIKIDYKSCGLYNQKTTFWEVTLRCDKINDTDHYDRLTKIDMETLRDNAKRLFIALDQALERETPSCK